MAGPPLADVPLVFGRPDGAFHALVGDKPGQTLEVDWCDIAPARP